MVELETYLSRLCNDDPTMNAIRERLGILRPIQPKPFPTGKPEVSKPYPFLAMGVKNSEYTNGEEDYLPNPMVISIIY